MSYVAVALSRVPLLPPAPHPPARTAAEWLWKHELQKKRRLKAEEDLPRAFCSRSFHRSRPPSRRGFDSPVVLFASSLGDQHRYNRRYVRVRNRRVARAVFPLRVCDKCKEESLAAPSPGPAPARWTEIIPVYEASTRDDEFCVFCLTLRSSWQYLTCILENVYIVTVIFPIVHLSSHFFISKSNHPCVFSCIASYGTVVHKA